MNIKELLQSVYLALKTIPVKGDDDVFTMAGDFNVMKTVINELDKNENKSDGD